MQYINQESWKKRDLSDQVDTFLILREIWFRNSLSRKSLEAYHLEFLTIDWKTHSEMGSRESFYLGSKLEKGWDPRNLSN